MEERTPVTGGLLATCTFLCPCKVEVWRESDKGPPPMSHGGHTEVKSGGVQKAWRVFMCYSSQSYRYQGKDGL